MFGRKKWQPKVKDAVVVRPGDKVIVRLIAVPPPDLDDWDELKAGVREFFGDTPVMFLGNVEVDVMRGMGS